MRQICRYDSTQTTGGKKVRRFGDAKVDGKITFEEHERRTLPCSRVELCERFLTSDDYKAFLERKKSAAEAAATAAQAKAAETAAAAAAAGAPAKAAAVAKAATAAAAKAGQPLHVSYFQHRICSCMVDEKMTQCADSIDTQFNALFATWKKLVQGWFEGETCSVDGCICKDPGFFGIASQKDLWAFLFRGECAPEPDPTRALPRDAAEHLQLRYGCIAAECEKKGCLKDKLACWAKCPVQNKKGSATEVNSKKWTPVPRGVKAKAPDDDDGDEDYDASKTEKWSKEMLPFEASRPDFMSLQLESMQVATPASFHTHESTAAHISS